MRRRLLAGCTFVAAIATVGSLYFSEVMGFPPCGLCWYQRVFMYPLVVVLGVAALEENASVWTTALPLSGLGLVTAVYHVVFQATATPGTQCTIGSGCGAVYWEGLGIFTIPRLSLLAFVLVTAGLLVLATLERRPT